MTKTADNAPRNTWNYDFEKYEKGSPLAMLAYDHASLWSAGGAFIPTFAWMIESTGSLFDTFLPFWGTAGPGMSDRYFDTAVLEHLLRVNTYYRAALICVGKGVRAKLYPAAEDACEEYADYQSLYRHLKESLNISSNEAVIVPAKHPLDNEFGDYSIPHVKEAYERMYHSYLDPLPEERWDLPTDAPVVWGCQKHQGRRSCISTIPPGFFGRLHLYGWPEVYYRKAWGFTDAADPAFLRELGITKVHTWFTDRKVWDDAGFEVEVIDETREGDRPWDMTVRVLQRRRDKVKGLIYGLASADLFSPSWMGMAIRNGHFGVYDPDWAAHYPKCAELAFEIGNRAILGTGSNWIHGIWDYMSLLGINRRRVPNTCVVPSIVRGIRQRPPKPEIAPWDAEYDDATLQRFKEEKKIGVTNLWGVMDAAYVSDLRNILDIHQTLRARAGAGIYLSWIEYCPHQIQKMFTETYAKYVEPLIFGWGASKLFPDDCLMPKLTKDDFRRNIELTLEGLRDILGEDHVPKGYLASWYEGSAYPIETEIEYLDKDLRYSSWEGAGLDSSPEEYKAQIPQLLKQKAEVIKDLGFKYYFGQGEYYRDGDFVHMPVSRPIQGSLLDYMSDAEKNTPDAGFVALNYDTGSGFMLGAGIASDVRAMARGADDPDAHNLYYGICSRARMVFHIAKGGDTGRLVPMKPGELVRYAQLLND